MRSTNLLVLELSDLVYVETELTALEALTKISNELLHCFDNDLSPCCLQNKSRDICYVCGSPVFLTEPFYESDILEYDDVFTTWLMGFDLEYQSRPKSFDGKVFVFPEAYNYIHLFTDIDKYSSKAIEIREELVFNDKSWDDFVDSLPF